MPFSGKKVHTNKNTDKDDDMSSISNITKKNLKRKPTMVSPVARKKKSTSHSAEASYDIEENVSYCFFLCKFFVFTYLLLYRILLQKNKLF